MSSIKYGVITFSDRAHAGVYPDQSGPALQRAASGYGWELGDYVVVPDEISAIQDAIRAQTAKGCRLILTTGGTGIAARDLTPEAVRPMASRELPGFGEVMRRESFKVTPRAILSRGLAVVVNDSLVICLPGSPAGSVECLGFVAEAVPHALELLQGHTDHP